jgi:hypothetical protein
MQLLQQSPRDHLKAEPAPAWCNREAFHAVLDVRSPTRVPTQGSLSMSGIWSDVE